MKHSVLMAFVDKDSGVYYTPGSFFISDNELRIKELANLQVINPHADFEFSKVPSVEVDLSSVALRTTAKTLKIKGYTKMSDEELEKAIAEHGGDVNDISESEERAAD